jgi:hypothetical protein
VRQLAILGVRPGSSTTVGGGGASTAKRDTRVTTREGTGKTSAQSGGGSSGGSRALTAASLLEDAAGGGDLPSEATSLFSAISQTIGGQAENLTELWNPPGLGFFARPSTKLILALTGVAVTGLIIVAAVSVKPAPAAKKAE